MAYITIHWLPYIIIFQWHYILNLIQRMCVQSFVSFRSAIHFPTLSLRTRLRIRIPHSAKRNSKWRGRDSINFFLRARARETSEHSYDRDGWVFLSRIDVRPPWMTLAHTWMSYRAWSLKNLMESRPGARIPFYRMTDARAVNFPLIITSIWITELIIMKLLRCIIFSLLYYCINV